MRRKAASIITTVAITTTKSLWPRIGVFWMKMLPMLEVPESAMMERWVGGVYWSRNQDEKGMTVVEEKEWEIEEVAIVEMLASCGVGNHSNF